MLWGWVVILPLLNPCPNHPPKSQNHRPHQQTARPGTANKNAKKDAASDAVAVLCHGLCSSKETGVIKALGEDVAGFNTYR